MKCPNRGHDTNRRPIVWPDDYLALEAEFCADELSRFHADVELHGVPFNRAEIMAKRDKFNHLWNTTHKEQFYVVNRGGKE